MTSLGTLEIGLKLNTRDYDQSLKQSQSDLNKLLKLKIAPTVDHSSLYALNKHFDLKVDHAKQVNKDLKKHRITPQIDLSNLDQLEEKIEQTKQRTKQAKEQIKRTTVTPTVNTENLKQLQRELKQTEERHFKVKGSLSSKTLTADVNLHSLLGLENAYANTITKHLQTRTTLSTKGLKVNVDFTDLDKLTKELGVLATGDFKAKVSAIGHRLNHQPQPSRNAGLGSQVAVELLSQILTATREQLKDRNSFLEKMLAIPVGIAKNYSAGVAYTYADIFTRNSLKAFDKTTGFNLTENLGNTPGKYVGKGVKKGKDILDAHIQTEAGQKGLEDLKAASQEARTELQKLKNLLDDFYTTGDSSKAKEAASQILNTSKAFSRVPTTPIDTTIKARRELAAQKAIEEARQKAKDFSLNQDEISQAKRVVFVSGGFAGAKGKSSHDVADLIRDKSDQNVSVVPIENKHTDLSVAIGENPFKWLSEAIRQPVGQGLQGYNKDSISMLSAAMAAREVNPDIEVEFVGYSGGGFVSEGATDLANRAGLNKVAGKAFATPGLVGKSINPNFQGFIGQNDPLRYASDVMLDPIGLARPNTAIPGIKSHGMEDYFNNPQVINEIIKDFDISMPDLGDVINDLQNLDSQPIENIQKAVEKIKEIIPLPDPWSVQELEKVEAIVESIAQKTASISVDDKLESSSVFKNTKELKDAIKSNRNFDDIEMAEKRTQAIKQYFKTEYAQIKELIEKGDLKEAKSKAHALIQAKRIASNDLEEILAELQKAGQDTKVGSKGVGGKVQSAKGSLSQYDRHANTQLERISNLELARESGITRANLKTATGVDIDSKALKHSVTKLVQETSKQILQGKNRQELETSLARLVSTLHPVLSGDLKVAELGEDVIAGLKVGLQNNQGELTSEMRAIASALPVAVREVLQINSPSKVFTKIGEQAGEGISVGFKKGVDEAEMIQEIMKVISRIKQTIHENAKFVIFTQAGDVESILESGYQPLQGNKDASIRNRFENQIRPNHAKSRSPIYGTFLDASTGDFRDDPNYKHLSSLYGDITLEGVFDPDQMQTHLGDSLSFASSSNSKQRFKNYNDSNIPDLMSQVVPNGTRDNMYLEGLLWDKFQITKVNSNGRDLSSKAKDLAKNKGIALSGQVDDLDKYNFKTGTKDISQKGKLEEMRSMLLNSNVGALLASPTHRKEGVRLLADIIRHLKADIPTLQTLAKSVGSNYIFGIEEGLESHKGELEKVGESTGDSLDESVRKALRIQSPSGQGKDVGINYILGILKGLKATGSDLKREIHKNITSLFHDIQSGDFQVRVTANVSEAIKSVTEFSNRMEQRGRTVGNNWAQRQIANMASNPISSVINTGSNLVGNTAGRVNAFRNRQPAPQTPFQHATQNILNQIRINPQVNQSVESLRDNFSQLQDEIRETVPWTQGLGEKIKLFAFGFLSLAGGVQIFQLLASKGKESLETFTQYTRTLNTLKALNLTGAENALSRVSDVAKDLSLNVNEARQGFAKLQSSFNFTSLKSQTEDIFGSFSLAASALQLSPDKQNQMFTAISQIASKSVVSMEELRQQLGEALPSALALSAKSMSMSIPEFMKLVTTGEVLAEDLLPKLAKELKNTFASNVEATKNSYIGQSQSLQNNLNAIGLAFGKFSANAALKVLPTINKLLEGLANNADLIPEILAVLAGSFTTLGLAAIAASGLVGKAFSAIMFGITSVLQMSRAALLEIVAVNGLAVVLGLTAYGAVKGFQYLNSMGSTELKDLAKQSADTVKSIQTELNRLNGININIKPTFDKNWMESAYDGWIDFLNSGRKGDDRLSSDYRTTDDLKEYAKQEDKTKTLNALMNEVAIKTGNLFNNQKGVDEYVAKVQELNKQSSNLKTTIRIVEQTGTLNSSDPFVKELKVKYGQDSESALKQLREDLAGVTTQIQETEFKFTPGGEQGIQDAIDKAKQIREEFNKIGDTQGVQETTTFINLLEKGLGKAREVAKLVAIEIEKVVTKFKEINRQNENRTFNIEMANSQSRVDKNKAIVSQGIYGYQRDLLGLNTDEVNLKREENNLQKRLQSYKKFVDGISKEKRRELEAALGTTLENANVGDINKARGTLTSQYETLPADLDANLTTLEGIKNTEKEIKNTQEQQTNLQVQQLDLTRARVIALKQLKITEADVNRRIATIAANPFGGVMASVENAQSDLIKQQETLQEQYRQLAESKDDPALSEAIAQTRLSIAQSQANLVQQQYELAQYYINLNRRVYDFNKQIRDYNRQIEDTKINDFRSVRSLTQSFEDLSRSLEKQLIDYSNQLETAQDKLNSTQMKNDLIKNLTPGTNSYARQLTDLFTGLVDEQDSILTEKRSFKSQQQEIETGYIQTMRQIVSIQEQQMDLERQRKRTIEDIKDTQINLNATLADLIRQTNKELGFIPSSITNIVKNLDKLPTPISEINNVLSKLPGGIQTSGNNLVSQINNLATAIQSQTSMFGSPAGMFGSPISPLSTDSPMAINGSLNDRVKAAVSFYLSKGLSPQGAAYLVGNFVQESGLDPNAKGDKDKNGNYTAFGLAQWRGNRRKGMPSDFMGQLGFALEEMQRDTPSLLPTLKNPNASIETIKRELKKWERYGIEGNRYGYGAQILKDFQTLTPIRTNLKPANNIIPIPNVKPPSKANSIFLPPPPSIRHLPTFKPSIAPYGMEQYKRSFLQPEQIYASGVSDMGQYQSPYQFAPDLLGLPAFNQKDLTPIPALDYSQTLDKAGQVKTLSLDVLKINEKINQVTQNIFNASAIDRQEQNILSVEDATRNLTQNVKNSAISILELTQNARGYLTITEQIAKSVQDVTKQYDDQIFSLNEMRINEERKYSGLIKQVDVIRDALKDTNLEPPVKEKMLQDFERYNNAANQAEQAISNINEQQNKLKNNRAFAIQSKQIEEYNNTIQKAKTDLGYSNADAAQSRYESGDPGAFFFNKAPILRARTRIDQERYELEQNLRQFDTPDNPFGQEYARKMRANFDEISENQLGEAFIDALPGMRDFGDALTNIITDFPNAKQHVISFVKSLMKLAVTYLVVIPLMKAASRAIGGAFGGGGGISGGAVSEAAFSGATVTDSIGSSVGMAYKGGLIRNFNDGGQVDNYARGGVAKLPALALGVNAIKALKRERRLGGGTPVLAALTVGEYVVPRREVADYLSYKQARKWNSLNDKAASIKNYAGGGIVGKTGMNYGNINSNSSSNSNYSQSNYNTTNIYLEERNDLGYSLNQIQNRNELQNQRNAKRYR